MDTALTLTQALLQAEAQARSTLDVVLHERLSAAVSLVKDGRVFQTSTGDWQVGSTSQEGLVYSVNGVCSCDDHHFNHPPQGLCKHRLAMFLSQRVLSLMQAPAAPVVPVEPWPDNDPEIAPPSHPVKSEAIPAIPDSLKQHILFLHGKPFVQYSGLLQVAHERGLMSLTTKIEFHSADLVLASATATFADGRSFTEWADATPANVKAHVRPHFPRMALTRAKARCLRDALNIGLTALEELGEVEP